MNSVRSEIMPFFFLNILLYVPTSVFGSRILLQVGDQLIGYQLLIDVQLMFV